MKKLNEQFEGICGRYLKIQQKYEEVTEAFRVFCTKKHQLAALCQPHDPDYDGQETADGTTTEPYPSEADKARIRETLAEVSDADLATMIRNTKPDLGALNDEMRMVFIARTVMDEAARRLEAKKEAE